MIKVYTDPTRDITIENWPSGPRRVTARFWIESVPGKGERVCRTTTGKPKKSTYAPRCAIVTGDCGRTFFLRDAGSFICVTKGTMLHEEETRWPKDDGYDDLLGHLSAVSGAR